jgi:hypothetical protein
MWPVALPKGLSGVFKGVSGTCYQALWGRSKAVTPVSKELMVPGERPEDAQGTSANMDPS